MVRVKEEGEDGTAKAGDERGEVDTLRNCAELPSIKLPCGTPPGKPCTFLQQSPDTPTPHCLMWGQMNTFILP